jgi:hypothetical protein
LANVENLEIVPLKVDNKDQLKAFVNGCDIVIHGGTPFQLDIKDPKTELLDPTIKGRKISSKQLAMHEKFKRWFSQLEWQPPI